MTFTKDPDEILDYTVDWTQRLQPTESIVSSYWSIQPSDPIGDLKQVIAFIGSPLATIWVAGGIKDKVYVLLNRVITNSNPARTMVTRFSIQC